MKSFISLWNYVEDITIDAVPKECQSKNLADLEFKKFCGRDMSIGLILDTDLGKILVQSKFLEDTIFRLSFIEDQLEKK